MYCALLKSDSQEPDSQEHLPSLSLVAARQGRSMSESLPEAWSRRGFLADQKRVPLRRGKLPHIRARGRDATVMLRYISGEKGKVGPSLSSRVVFFGFETPGASPCEVMQSRKNNSDTISSSSGSSNSSNDIE